MAVKGSNFFERHCLSGSSVTGSQAALVLLSSVLECITMNLTGAVNRMSPVTLRYIKYASAKFHLN